MKRPLTPKPARYGQRRRALFFYAAAGLLLAFFAIAAAHELIPGLCADDESEEDCPFCKLLHTLALVALAAALSPSIRVAISGLSAGAPDPPRPPRFPHFQLRAPPRG